MRTDSREMLALGMVGCKSRLRERIELLLSGKRTFSPVVSSTRLLASMLTLSTLTLASSLAPRWIAFAQEQSHPQLEVASIHLNRSERPDSLVNLPDTGRLEVANATLKTVIRNAYGIQSDQVVGGPKWLDTDRYDIQAKTAGPIDEQQEEPLMQSLLAERFHLRTHWGTRDLPFYALTLAETGPKFKENPEPYGSMRVSRTGGIAEIRATRMTLGQLGGILGRQLGRVVLNKTGLNGYYDIILHWDQEQATDSSGPSIFAALREQLGLKLGSGKGPVPVLVVDHAEQPDAN